MASASISELIMFIAAVTVAAGVATTLTLNVADISHSLDQQSLDFAADIDTDIVIISDAGSVDSMYDGSSTVTLLVKNTGERTLQADTSSRTTSRTSATAEAPSGNAVTSSKLLSRRRSTPACTA